jgi:hypothetical protein
LHAPRRVINLQQPIGELTELGVGRFQQRQLEGAMGTAIFLSRWGAMGWGRDQRDGHLSVKIEKTTKDALLMSELDLRLGVPFRPPFRPFLLSSCRSAMRYGTCEPLTLQKSPR